MINPQVPVTILAGGLGTRLAEETDVRPKPMVAVGGRPLLWHIMKGYAQHGHKDFHIALGYKGELIKQYFANYHLLSSDFTVELATGRFTARNLVAEPWTVHLHDTGLQTQTGGRLRRILDSVQGPMMATYGDGVGNIDISALLRFHRAQGKLATITAVRPPSRFGEILIEDDCVSSFHEKPQIGDGWINGGFFVLEPQVKEYLADDQTVFEREPLERLASEGQLAAYRHDGFWQCMDTLRDVKYLNSLWDQNQAHWKTWAD